MPKFKTIRGMPGPRLLTQIGDELHVDGRVYRVSDLSEIVGRVGLPPQAYPYPGTSAQAWGIRGKRGFLASTRVNSPAAAPFYATLDYDTALCGVWKDAEIAGFGISENAVRNFAHGPYGVVYDYDKVSGAILNYDTPPNALINSTDNFVTLKKTVAGRLLLSTFGTSGAGATSVETLPLNAQIVTAPTAILGTRSVASLQQHPRRIFENDSRSFFLSTYIGQTGNTQLQLNRVAHSSLALTTISSNLQPPVGAASVSGGYGYTNSGPSYAIETDVDELSSYIAYRHAGGIEIHRTQLNVLEGTTTATNNLVTLDQNPMTTHAGNGTSIRCVVAKLPNGDKFLLVMSVDVHNIAPTPATSKLYCYKIVSKNVLEYVGTSQLAVGPRNYLGASDDWTRFIVAYDDRYEMWTVGTGGALTLSDTVMTNRYNGNQYCLGDSYSFDSVGRFWYVNAEATKPVVLSEQALSFIAPPGAVNTIKLAFDQDGYEFTGAAVPGNIAVSVTDINGNYLVATVKLNGTSNVTLGNDTVITSATGPTNVPFSVVAPGEVSISGETV